MIIALLGRQPALGIAELERRFGPKAVTWFSGETAVVSTDSLVVEQFGGIQKAGRVVAKLSGDWQAVSKKIIQAYADGWSSHEGKITLGISAYGFANLSPREVQKTGIVLKSRLKKSGVSLRLVPNSETALSSATSHHNKLGLSNNKVELLVVRDSRANIIVAESCGAQNITALAARDQGRPKRDAFVGMLPPKLALQMVNLAVGASHVNGKSPLTILDPFCGTGVVLQEALLRHYSAYGTDLSAKMIEYSKANLDWLVSKFHISDATFQVHEGDAMTAQWHAPISAVACESYLGQPFSAPPSPPKLKEVRRNCDYIIGTFLKNLAAQIPAGTPLCIAVPAWRDIQGSFTHLPLIGQLEALGYERVVFKNITADELLYYRENQVVARELLVLIKK